MPPNALRTRPFARASPNAACKALTSGTKTWAWILACWMTETSTLNLSFWRHLMIIARLLAIL